MEDLLKKFEEKKPEIIFEWKDKYTDAEGWIVINSLRGGAAAGGTRMRIGVTRDEVLALAKTMEIKFTIAGPLNALVNSPSCHLLSVPPLPSPYN